ncbi:virB8 family protein [Helicobacter pylori]|uniref:type IV secretion system protein n=1 Tax=Helicobacter pylori TaxID=210 RepID=UPI000FDD28B1|nr:virB8 family protein [Helicobacter pylori]RVY83875.1 virB8 family protein [Helicobacter pylori]WQW85200.1 virB8 family protein [Helicobacter pylori]
MREKPFNSEQLVFLEELLSHQEKHLENKLSGFSVNDLDMQSVFRLERNRLKIAYKLLGLMSFIALILAIVLISILPLQKTEHHFVDFLNQDKHYAIIQRADKSISSNEALARSLIGAYVLNRESINRIDDKSRYELVRLQSSSKVWQRFEDLIKTQNSIYAQSHLEREVHIVNIAIYQQDNNPIASVSIAAKLTNENKLVYEKRYKIVLSYLFDTPDFDYASMPKNPTGFKITRYSITEIAPTNRGD